MNATKTAPPVTSLRAHASDESQPYVNPASLLLVIALGLWFAAIRSPLWLDETASYWQIYKGLAEIPHRHGINVPAYSYILWGASKVLGTSEIALRIPSVLAMLGAVYLLFLSARELFESDVAKTVAIVFCLHPIVAFAAIDARPYAFATLAVCASMYLVLRLWRRPSTWLAALLGLSCALILNFHLLFAVILPVLAICVLIPRSIEIRQSLCQSAVALTVFAVACIPIISTILLMVHTREDVNFAKSPSPTDFFLTVCPLPFMVGLTYVLSVLGLRTPYGVKWSWNHDWRRFLFCASTAFLPLLILFSVSTGTNLHIFVPRYRLVALPGLALCYGLVIKRLDLQSLRVGFSAVMLVATVAYLFLFTPWNLHSYSWKDATDFARQNTASDHATVVMCSDFIQSDLLPMPQGAQVYDSDLFPSLTYYKLDAPVVPLPRSLNSRTEQLGLQFLNQATSRNQRFLALAHSASFPVLEWLAHQAPSTYQVRTLGTFDTVAVVEFAPRAR